MNLSWNQRQSRLTRNMRYALNKAQMHVEYGQTESENDRRFDRWRKYDVVHPRLAVWNRFALDLTNMCYVIGNVAKNE